jgi:hypothetical protein
MRDERKFRLLVGVSFIICILVFAYNISSEYFLQDMEGYLKRRIYYERVISKKGLSLHEAMYWKKGS